MSTNLRSRVGTPTNLPQGATYDLLMITYENGFPESKLLFEIADTPRKVTGVQKVAQLFMKILYTSRGSNVIYPNQGTLFNQMTINANVLTNDTIFNSELAAQVRSAESQTKAILNTVGSDPASMLERASLMGLETGKDSMVMFVKLLTRAGENASVAIPFPQLDLAFSK